MEIRDSPARHKKDSSENGAFPKLTVFISIILLLSQCSGRGSLVVCSSSGESNLTNLTTSSNSSSESTQTPSSHGLGNQQKAEQNDSRQVLRLECQPGEERQFAYDSSTRVWGRSKQQVRLRATLRLRCMEPANNSSLKYMGEIVELEPSFGLDLGGEQPAQVGPELRRESGGAWAASRRLEELRAARAQRGGGLVVDGGASAMLREGPRAEPLLEEVGEAAGRVRRSVSGWLSKAWGSVKEFFVNIFQSSDRSSVSREQAFKDSGLDIAGQCKAAGSAKGGGKSRGGLPFDESVFEDLGPEYYVGASTAQGAPEAAYEFSDDELRLLVEGGAEDQVGVSFFDDPGGRRARTARAAAGASSAGAGGARRWARSARDLDHARQLRMPFVFVQSRAGRILEIRFGADETDLSTKNFKRHLCDLFATNLDQQQPAAASGQPGSPTSSTNGTKTMQQVSTSEVSPIGKHQTRYTVDASADSLESIKRAALRVQPATVGGGEGQGWAKGEQRPQSGGSGSAGGQLERQNLVRVLALVGGGELESGSDGNGPTGGRQSNAGGHDNLQPQASSVAVLRSINTTSALNAAPANAALAALADIERVRVQVQQVQQISAGRLTGTAGQLSVSLVVEPSGQPAEQQTRAHKQAGHTQRAARGRAKRTPEVPAANSPAQDEAQHEASSGQLADVAELLQVSTSFSLRLVPVPRRPDGSIDEGTVDSESPAGNAAAEGPQAAPKRLDKRAASAIDYHRQAGALAADAQFDSRRTGGAASARQPKSTARRAKQRAPLYRPAPGDPAELQRTLADWRRREARLQLSPSPLVAEQSAAWEADQLRLDTMRDQVRQRLNEEFVRNRVRRSLGANLVLAQQARQTVAGGPSDPRPAAKLATHEEAAADEPTGHLRRSANGPADGDLGLGLTQLILGNGITAKRKGSIYSTLEEVLELESSLADDLAEDSITRLIGDTIKMDRLRHHCRSSVPTVERFAQSMPQQARHIERRMPFGLAADQDQEQAEDEPSGLASGAAREAKSAKEGQAKGGSISKSFKEENELRLGQCKQVLKLLLKIGDRRGADLALELVDECNARLQTVARNEELGYGPIGKYYRRLRYHFVELLSYIERPTDSLIDKLVARLYYPKVLATSTTNGDQSPSSTSNNGKARKSTTAANSNTSQREMPEFVYVNTVNQNTRPIATTKYNKTILKEEDDFNNSDGAAQLLMTLTKLAAKNGVSKKKRQDIVDKLLGSLKSTSCSLFDAPDLDILESMANFRYRFDEMIPRILYLARRCRQSDQYLTACVHALSGQLAHSLPVQRFLADQLKSDNSSCLLKSEIVATLINAQLINDLRLFGGVNHQEHSRADGRDAGDSSAATNQWPSYGSNLVDETLLDIVGEAKPSESDDQQVKPGTLMSKRLEANRRCLAALVGEYFANKRPNGKQQFLTNNNIQGSSHDNKRRTTRAVVNDQNFWDEAQCKRWTIPATADENFGLGGQNGTSGIGILQAPGLELPHSMQGVNGSTKYNDLLDEIDDSSLLNALINQQQRQQRSKGLGSRAARGRGQKMLNGGNSMVSERESTEGSNSTGNSLLGSQQQLEVLKKQIQQQQANETNSGPQVVLRKRHKCVGEKKFGPRNAQALVTAEIVNDLVGPRDENKFLARFRLSTNFLGNKIDVGRMYLWHQRRTTRAHANILGRSVWDTSRNCEDKAPAQTLYMPLFDFNLWLVKVSVGLRLNAEMGFFSDCVGESIPESGGGVAGKLAAGEQVTSPADELKLYPSISLRAAGEATAKLVVARAGMSLASQYSYQGNIKVSRQPDSCMSISSAHQPMNITFSSWFQLWDNDCQFWGSRSRAEPQAVRWSLMGRKPIVWIQDECLNGHNSTAARTSGRGRGTDNQTQVLPAENFHASREQSSDSLGPVSPVTINP